MALRKERREELEGLCLKFRRDLIKLLHSIQTGHPGGSLSSAEIMTTLYWEKLKVSPETAQAANRDRFILGKGHAAPMLYLILAERGFFPKEDLATLRQLDSHLQGHPSAKTTPGVELSTGPLGLGLAAGLGMALGARLEKRDYTTYVLMGDGELQEGIVWEAAMSAAKFKVDNLIAIVDNNGVQLDGTVEEIMPMGDLKAKWTAFGWNVIETDGHDVGAVSDALDAAKAVKGQPTVIIARTVKGKGVSFMEGKSAWHGKPISKDEYVKAMGELGVMA
jgi:transketolase